MSDEVDDWEQADISALKIEAEKVIMKPSVVIPARLLARPINADIIFFQDGSSAVSNPPPLRHETPPTLTVPSTTSVYDDNLDPVLLDALRNPRERLHVLNIEHSIYTFTMSSERSMEFPPVLNSFRRLIAYRVAHRFRLGHSPSDMMNENGERGIVFYKLPETFIPNPLLIDIDVTTGDPQQMQQTQMNVTGSPSAVTVDDSQAMGDLAGNDQNQQQPPKKVVVMKRRDNGGAELKKERTAQQTVSAADKEKAYAEARARIFGVESMSAPSVDSDSVLSAMSSVAVTPSSSVSNLASCTEPTSTSILTSAPSNASILAVDITAEATTTVTGNRPFQPPVVAPESTTSSNILEEDDKTIACVTKEQGDGSPKETAKTDAKVATGRGTQSGGTKTHGVISQSSGNVKSSRVPRSGPPPSPIGVLNAEPLVSNNNNNSAILASAVTTSAEKIIPSADYSKESAGDAVTIFSNEAVKSGEPQQPERSQSVSPQPSSSTIAVATKKTASSSNLLESAKSIQRDQTAEKYDPDFSRGRAVPAHSPVTIPASSGGPAMGGPGVGMGVQPAGGVRMMYPVPQSQLQYHQPYANQYHPSPGQDQAYASGQTVYYTSNANPLQPHGQMQQQQPQQQWMQVPPHIMIPGQLQYAAQAYYPHPLSAGPGVPMPSHMPGLQYNYSFPPLQQQQQQGRPIMYMQQQEPQQQDQSNRQRNRHSGQR